MTNVNGKPTFYINSSALSQKSTCNLRLRYTICDGYVPYGKDIGDYNDVHYGTCWHLYRQVLAATGGNHYKALVEAMGCWHKKEAQLISRGKHKNYITKDFLGGTILNFSNQYKMSADNPSWWNSVGNFSYFIRKDGSAFTEQKIQFPYYSCDSFDLILVGTIDALGFINDSFVLLDDKTTSSYDIDDFFAKYKSSNQMMLYTWMIRKLSEMYPESELGQIFTDYPNFSTSIFGVFHSAKEVQFKRSPLITFNHRQMESFEAALVIKLAEIQELCHNFVNHPTYKHREGFINGMCLPYGSPCPYVAACTSESEEDEEATLKAMFQQKPYNPTQTHEDL